ncbi:unnamed protein product, partial [Rotaria sp. Silwood1]
MTAESKEAGAMKLCHHKQAKWYWKSNPNAASTHEKEEWMSYSDIESEIIEKAFNDKHKTTLVELDDYWIDLNNSIAISKHGYNKLTPIKRVPINSPQNQRLRGERFSGLPESIKHFNEWTNGGYWFIKQWKDQQSPDISYSEIVEQAANGIITEAQLIEKSDEAKRMADQLLHRKGYDKVEIHKCSIELYTMESFLYKLVNKTLRDNDKSKLNTLGPYCYLLYHSWYMMDDKTMGKVYRGADLQPGAEALADTLKVNQNLTTLLLNDNRIADKGAEALSHALKVNQNLTTFVLGGNRIADKGAEALAHALKVNQNLTTLVLGGNRIADKGAKALAEALKFNQTLTTLLLDGNPLADKGAKALADALKVNQTLTELNLSCTQMSHQGAESLADALKLNRNLRILLVHTNVIADEGAEALADALQVNETLTELYLGCNHISYRGAEGLAHALKVNENLSTLGLGGNRIADKAAEALANALKVNRNLTTLLLDGNRI